MTFNVQLQHVSGISINDAFDINLVVHHIDYFLTVTCSCCPYLYFGSVIMLVTYFVNFR